MEENKPYRSDDENYNRESTPERTPNNERTNNSRWQTNSYSNRDNSNNRSDRPYRSTGNSYNKPYNQGSGNYNRDDRNNSGGYNRSDRSHGGGYGNRDDRPYRPSGNSNSDGGYRKPYNSDRPAYSSSEHRPVQPLNRKPIVIKRNNGPLRLNKFLSNAGICSRREADVFIKAGLVSVNGTIITEMGVKVMPTDDIRYNGQHIREERKVYILLNKPKDYITTMDDPHAKQHVMELIDGACKERVYPVGRLDRNTTGVLLFTNDGDLTTKLIHPSFEKKKIYQVGVDKIIKSEHLEAILKGIELEDGTIKADAISYIDDEDHRKVGIEIHSGKNRIVRRIFEHLGYKVYKLDRVYFCGLIKKGLQRGQWRFLYPKEISMLKMGQFV